MEDLDQMIAKCLPSFFTIGNLFAGIVSILFVYNGKMKQAVLLIILAMVMDSVDGYAARRLNAESEFGKVLDSLSDLVSFGIAPAFLMYVTIIHELQTAGILLTALFPVCGALRLARFHTQKSAPNTFIGMPIPAAGCILAILALFTPMIHKWEPILFILLLSYLMISKLTFVRLIKE